MARYPIKMLLDKDLGPFIPYLPSNAVVVEGSDETVADQIIDLHNEIEEKISNVYRYKGSVTFENLPTTGQVTGDVYNITNDFELDGHMYTAGTNVAWATDHWDPLTGLLNLDSTISELDLSVDLMTSVRSINGYAFTVEANKVQWLKMINDAIKAGKTTINFITTRDTGYFFRLYIPTTSDGVQNISMFITTPINLLYNLQYGDTYWYGKTVKITFADGVATDITVQTGSGYSYREWLYPQFRNTTAFTPTADTHLATKKYVDDGLSLKEALANKVTALLGTSTDTEYPSAKAVYDFVLANTTPITDFDTTSNNKPFIFSEHGPGVYIYTGYNDTIKFYYKKDANDTVHIAPNNKCLALALFITKDVTTIETPQQGSITFAYLLYRDSGSYLSIGNYSMYSFGIDNTGNITGSNISSYGKLLLNTGQQIQGVKTFTLRPRLDTSVAEPTLTNEFITKEYVDQNVMPGLHKIESSYPLSVIDNTGNLMYDIAHDSDIMTYVTELVSKAYFKNDYKTGPLYFYNIYEDGIFYKIEMDLSTADLANHNKITIKPVYTADLLQRLNTGKGYWTEAVFTTSGYNVSQFSKFVYDSTTGISGDIFNVLVTNNMEPYTPTLDYAPANKKYVDDTVAKVTTMPTADSTLEGKVYQYIGTTDGTYTKGYFYECVSDGATPTPNYSWVIINYGGSAAVSTDLSQYVELVQSNPDTFLRNVRYANVGDSFSLTYIVGTSVDTIATAFYVKLPASHYYKTLPSAYTYEPIGAVTYFEYDTQTQSADPKNAYGYLTYNPSDPDYVEIKIYPVDYNGQIGILANSYFYVNCNWIRI